MVNKHNNIVIKNLLPQIINDFVTTFGTSFYLRKQGKKFCCIFCLKIEITPIKSCFGTETACHVRNLVTYLIFKQNAK